MVTGAGAKGALSKLTSRLGGDVCSMMLVLMAPEFVRLNVAGDETPGAVAVTVYDPSVLLAVNTGAWADPLASLTAVPVKEDPANVPLAPEEGAVKLTATPDTGYP
jgi:hypothetical protein